MPLPLDFNEFEHLQSTIRSIQNKIVRNEFRDLGEDWDINPDITTPRGSLRAACTHDDSDTADMSILRLYLYYFILRKASDLQPAIYGIPVVTHQETWTFTPQVRLYFSEDPSDVEPGYNPIEGEITFRLPGETSESITKAKTVAIANDIKRIFGTGAGYRWHKGWNKVTYLDKQNGYDFRLLVFDYLEGERIIRDVLSVRSHIFDDALFQKLERGNPSKAFPVSQPANNIYGKFRKAPRKRPRGYVRFRYAQLFIHGLVAPLLLVDVWQGKPDLTTID